MTLHAAAEQYANETRAALHVAQSRTALAVAEAAFGVGCFRWVRGKSESRVTDHGGLWTIDVRVGTPLDRAHWLVALRFAEWCLERDGAPLSSVRAMRAQVASSLLLPTDLVLGELYGDVVSAARRLRVTTAALTLRRGEVERRPTVLVSEHYARVRGDDAGRVPRDLATLRACVSGSVVSLMLAPVATVAEGNLMAA